MNQVSKKFCLALAGTALLLAGCAKKPMRPDPGATVLGPQSGGTVAPQDLSTTPTVDASAGGLENRDANFDANGQLRGKLEAVFFSFDKSDISEKERPKLQAAAEYLKTHADQRLLLEGHCDWRGTAEYNLGLGDRRAAAAKAYLVKLGVATEKLETLSKGSLEGAKNGDDASMAKDRRTELVVLKK